MRNKHKITEDDVIRNKRYIIRLCKAGSEIMAARKTQLRNRYFYEKLRRKKLT